jgi:glycosyltransferase involved in cell wall biosynthesis
MAKPGGTIAYVLKSFPRLSETFIASEIYRLERQGASLRLFVIKHSHEPFAHPIVEAIRAPRVHLPAAAPISAISAAKWLALHLSGFAAPMARQLRHHPLRTAYAAAVAFGHAVRARKRTWGLPRKSTLKEFLQAVALADAIRAAGDVRHIHAHFCHSATTVAWLAALMTALPLSFTAHAKDMYCADLNPAGLLIRKLNAAQFVVTCTMANRTYLQALTSTPVYCIYHGLDVEFARLCGLRPPLRRFDGHVRALSVGRLVPKKGIDVFIEACAILRARGLQVEATIVGESGEQEQALRRLTAAHGLSAAVTFTGPLSQAELFTQYTRATVFCLPCRVLENGDRDGIPNVMAEAMACGLPVVTTAVSGIPELLTDGVNGVLVAPDSPNQVADAIEALHQDPTFAERLSRNAQTRVREHFNGDEAVATLSRLLADGVA